MLRPKYFLITIIILFLCFTVLIVKSIRAQAPPADQEITVTTYYPAPYGDYQDLDVHGTLTVHGTLVLNGPIRYPVEDNGGMTQFTIWDDATTTDIIVTSGVNTIPPVIFLKYPGASTDAATGITHPPGGYFTVGILDNNFILKNAERTYSHYERRRYTVASDTIDRGETPYGGDPRQSVIGPLFADEAGPPMSPVSGGAGGYYICVRGN